MLYHSLYYASVGVDAEPGRYSGSKDQAPSRQGLSLDS